jgi:hypothetical protein
MTQDSNKLFILSFMLLFAVSTAILLSALSGFVIPQRNKSTPRYDLSHQVAIYLFPLILVGMWIYREALALNSLLPGVAWRRYFFLSIWPHALSLWNLEQHQ